MTRQRDIERTLETFFVDGPMQMPERVFDGVLDQVERTPQRRLARLLLRFTDMSTTARLLAAGAAAVLIVGVGFVAFGRGPGPTVGGPQPSASSSPRPSPSVAAQVPAELVHPFLGSLRTGPNVPTGFDRSIISFTSTTFAYNETGLVSTASMPAPGTLRLESIAARDGCAVGDAGTYTYALSPGANRLTATLQADDCAARAAVVPGDWLRSVCPNPDNFCLGDLEPGAYSSEYIDPFIPTGSLWQPRFGAMTYTVPAGWQNSGDWPTDYHLQPQGSPGDDGIHVYSEVAIVSEEDTCSERASSTIGRTARAITDWLGSASGVVATAPVAVTVGGLTGWRLDLTLDPAWTTTCSFSEGKPSRGLFTGIEPGWQRNLGPGGQMRVHLLDLGAGRAMLITIEGSTKAIQDAHLAEATAIVDSIAIPR